MATTTRSHNSTMGSWRGIAYAREGGLAAMFIVRGADGLEERLSPAFAAAFAS